ATMKKIVPKSKNCISISQAGLLGSRNKRERRREAHFRTSLVTFHIEREYASFKLSCRVPIFKATRPFVSRRLDQTSALLHGTNIPGHSAIAGNCWLHRGRASNWRFGDNWIDHSFHHPRRHAAAHPGFRVDGPHTPNDGAGRHAGTRAGPWFYDPRRGSSSGDPRLYHRHHWSVAVHSCNSRHRVEFSAQPRYHR